MHTGVLGVLPSVYFRTTGRIEGHSAQVYEASEDQIRRYQLQPAEAEAVERKLAAEEGDGKRKQEWVWVRRVEAVPFTSDTCLAGWLCVP